MSKELLVITLDRGKGCDLGFWPGHLGPRIQQRVGPPVAQARGNAHEPSQIVQRHTVGPRTRRRQLVLAGIVVEPHGGRVVVAKPAAPRWR